MSSAFVIKSARIEALSIVLKDGNVDTLNADLQANAANLSQFQNMPFLLDVHLLPDPWGLDIKEVVRCFSACHIKIIGIRHIEADYAAKVAQYDLAFSLVPKDKEVSPTAPNATQPVAHTTQSSVQQEQVERLKNQVLQLKQQLQQMGSQTAQEQMQVQHEQVERLKTQVLQLKQQLQQAEQAHAQVQALQQEVQQLKEQRQPESEQPQPKQPVQRNLPTSSPTIIMDKPVRSGQQVYAEGGDVICTALVSQGAEIIADGNIHIYAPFRGRALAGASGDKNARIFIHSMQGQLVSIAGIYRVFDKELPASLHGKSVVVSLDGGKLNITALSGIS